MELDAAERSRLTYALYNASGLGYSWCNSNCETPDAILRIIQDIRPDLHRYCSRMIGSILDGEDVDCVTLFFYPPNDLLGGTLA